MSIKNTNKNSIIGIIIFSINIKLDSLINGINDILTIKIAVKKYIINDLNQYIILLHKFLKENTFEDLLDDFMKIIYDYNLSCSYKGILVPEKIKKKYIKTYYAKFNKKNYLKLRDDFNDNKDRIDLLYILLVYGFNHMIRFNKGGKFNLPVGNVDFNKNVVAALKNYSEFIGDKEFNYYNMDYKSFIINSEFKDNDYVYLDPPYLISNSEYNKMWSQDKEIELYEIIDELDRNNVYFGLSNITSHKGNENLILKEWMNKYKVYEIESNYISRFDNTVKKNSKEVFITNYEKIRV